MNVIQADITTYLDQVPNAQELLPQELAAVSALKEQGLLEHLFLKANGTSAILIFKDMDEAKAQELVSALPMAAYFHSVAYAALDARF
jgi:muconolactone delta-isomerase